MILRRYGNTYHRVIPNFDARAMNEIGFTRTGDVTIPVDEFQTDFERTESHELTAATDGPVKDEAEQALLNQLRSHLDGIAAKLGEGDALVIESEATNYPKTRARQQNKPGADRAHFFWTIDPPLRVGIYRRKR